MALGAFLHWSMHFVLMILTEDLSFSSFKYLDNSLVIFLLPAFLQSEPVQMKMYFLLVLFCIR